MRSRMPSKVDTVERMLTPRPDLGMSILTNVTAIYQSDLVPASARARAVGYTVAGYAVTSLLATVTV